MTPHFTQRFLVIYSGVLTAVFAGTVIGACASAAKNSRFDEIDVQRINVIEPDGTIRLVISNKTRFPGSFFQGKEVARPDRHTTGLLFVNDDGTEMGGLTFDGTKARDGQITSDGHLSFDQYDQDQLFAIDAGQEGAAKKTMLVISDRGDYSLLGAMDEIARIKALPAQERQAAIRKFAESHPGDHPRVLLGRAADRSAVLRLEDTEGRDRIVLKVAADGAPHLQFLDATGTVIDELPRNARARH